MKGREVEREQTITIKEFKFRICKVLLCLIKCARSTDRKMAADTMDKKTNSYSLRPRKHTEAHEKPGGVGLRQNEILADPCTCLS